MHRRFCRWRDKGVWEGLLEALIAESDFEWLIPHRGAQERHWGDERHQAAGLAKKKGGGSTPRYAWPWMCLVCRSDPCHGRYRVGLRSCTGPDREVVGKLSARRQAYDTDAILSLARKTGMEPVVPPKSNRQEQRDYDKHIYRQRHMVQNVFMHLKRWRDIATRYAKNALSFEAAVQIRCRAVSTYLVTTLPRLF